ncbi:MAG: gamma-glutamyltransferase [Gammaproteobacteria bacterium]|nr:gamma-glutamyltransferase [Gammaproteobacteria bacterium]
MRNLLITFLFVSSLNSTDYIDYLHPFHPTKSKEGMVVSQSALSSDIGVKILDMGGNAVDAAVAVGFSLAITLPRAGNLGGGGFMLIYLKERDEIFYIDYRSKSPRNSSIEKLLGTKKIPERNSKLWERVDYTYLASAVPGTVYGLLEAHKNFGSLNLEQIMQPVIEQAEEGIVVSSDLNYVIEVTPQIRADKESFSIFFKDGKALKESSIMKRPDLANTFKEISKNGTKGFYEGVVAEKIVNAMNENNGLISSEDLKNYKSFFRMPIAINYKGYKVFTAAPPSGGGITLLTALSILNNIDISKYKSDSTKTYHFLAESLRRGHNNRSHFVGDPDYFDVPISDLLSKNRIAELFKTIDSNKSSSVDQIKAFKPRIEGKDTTHFSIIDKYGNAVSNTYTLGLSFGSGVTIPDTGILMNSQMNNFAYRYGDKNVIGRVASPGNRFEPGKKPMSTMSPTIIFDKDDDLFLITGSPGGSDIPAAILRVITGVIDFELDIGEATMLPRIHKDWPYTGLEHERALSIDTIRRLKSMGHKTEYETTIGSTQSIHVVEGINNGFADLRRPNAGVAVQTN